MYCVKCGVELSDSETRCPLCGTAVFHPEISRPAAEPPYPRDACPRPEEVNRTGLLFILTVLFLLAAIITLLCDWRMNGSVVWSGYAAGGLLLGYIIFILPFWFHSPSPVVFVPVDFAAAALYLLYINYASGGRWFLTFALPVTGGAALIVTAVITLVHYLHAGYLFIYGGAFLLTGGYVVMLEFLLNLTFHIHEVFFWSFYPLSVCTILGLALILIGTCRPLRESLHKKFFL